MWPMPCGDRQRLRGLSRTHSSGYRSGGQEPRDGVPDQSARGYHSPRGAEPRGRHARVGDSHFLISESLLPDRKSLSSVYRALKFKVPPASIEEHYGDWQRLVREINHVIGPARVTTNIWVLRTLAGTLRMQGGKVTVLLQEEDTGILVDDVEAGHLDVRAYGVAIDIGTTTIAVKLVDLLDSSMLASRASYNAQIRRGADIISRIDYARTPKHLLECESGLETMNGLNRAGDVQTRESITRKFGQRLSREIPR